MEAITESFQSNFTAQQILLELVNVTQPVENSTKRAPEVFGGDLVIAVNVLVQVADYNAEQGNVSTEQDVENFAEVTSNLLEPVNTITWQELENVSTVTGSPSSGCERLINQLFNTDTVAQRTI